ncbi:MAG: PEP-utilizing enzyme, partial [Phycisphaerales bacterium]|nr:PEP-utilizing enzyme [Phycisphaerales bacterium]
MQTIKGIAVFPGIVIARALVLEQFRERIPYHRVADGDVARELKMLAQAIADAQASLQSDRDRVEADLGPEPAKIFEFHLGLLNDPALMDPVRVRIEQESVTAAFSVSDAFSTLANKFRDMGSEVFRDKARDILDLERRLIEQLLGQTEDRMATLTEPVVIVGHEMTPRQASSLTEEMVVGLATDFGGRTDHTSIVAAALGMPVVVGCQELTEHVDDGDVLIIDGVVGEVIVDPDAATVAAYEERIVRLSEARSAVSAGRDDEAVTIDGTNIVLMGNIEFPREIPSLIDKGGEGVGLYRTEFLYLTSTSEPTEEELYD